jgi:hypothetical protein
MRFKEIVMKLAFWVLFWTLVQFTDWKKTDWFYLFSTIVLVFMVVLFRKYYDLAEQKPKKRRAKNEK